MKKSLTIAALATMLALSGCSGDNEAEIVTGIIVEKEIKPQTTQKKLTPIRTYKCTGKGDNRKCTWITTSEKVTVTTTPACYQLELNNGWEDCVDQDIWNALDIDDVYDSSKY